MGAEGADREIGCQVPGEELDRDPVFPDDPLADCVVGEEKQPYRIGSEQLGVGMACNHNGDGAGQTIWWFRGYARQVPEPPGTRVLPGG